MSWNGKSTKDRNESWTDSAATPEIRAVSVTAHSETKLSEELDLVSENWKEVTDTIFEIQKEREELLAH